MFGGGLGQQQTNQNPNNDTILQGAPADSVSCLAFPPNPNSNVIAVGAWDGTVRCWEFQQQGGLSGPITSQRAVNQITHQAPVLSVSWSADGQYIFSAGCDNKGYMWHVAGGGTQFQQIAQHDAPIKSIICVPEMNCVVTGSWDRSLKFWDTRSPNPAAAFTLPDKVYCMDCRFPYLAVATAHKSVLIYNLSGQPRPHKAVACRQEVPAGTRPYQRRALAMFPDKSGYALGTIEGRVHIQYIDHREHDPQMNFAYKCHREESKNTPDRTNHIHSVNSIAFHPCGTFATAGSDGQFCFWDKDKRQRLKQFQKMPGPIPCASFNARGDIFAYAVSYDWSRGAEYYNRQDANNIYLHYATDDEIKPKKKT